VSEPTLLHAGNNRLSAQYNLTDQYPAAPTSHYHPTQRKALANSVLVLPPADAQFESNGSSGNGWQQPRTSSLVTSASSPGALSAVLTSASVPFHIPSGHPHPHLHYQNSVDSYEYEQSTVNSNNNRDSAIMSTGGGDFVRRPNGGNHRSSAAARNSNSSNEDEHNNNHGTTHRVSVYVYGRDFLDFSCFCLFVSFS